MARIQALPLSPRALGAASETPFVVIIDRAVDVDAMTGLPVWTQERCEDIKTETGAALVLVTEAELTVANVDEELHRAAEAAVARALCPERVVQV